MVRVVPVQMQYNPRAYWFDPKELELFDGARVIVSTERGTEYGICSGGVREVEEAEIAKLKSALKPVLRLADDHDMEQVELMRQKSQEALPVFRRIVEDSGENMRPIMVEYLYDGLKAIFFFESEERIDFRNLVRELSSELGIRVDMRQIGVRDEARLVGGLGHCGQELCCRRLGGEFSPVSIRMAKEQDLSLNPQKISGVCGRLMCCLRYEFEAYKDFKSRAPKMNATVSTPEGKSKVVGLNVPRELVTVQLEEDSKRVTFPLSAMDEPAEEGKRPNSIGDVFGEYANPDPFAESVSLGLFDTAGFTREDKLGDSRAHHTKPIDAQGEDGKAQAKPSRRRRRRSGGQGKPSSSQQDREMRQAGDADADKKPSSSRRRSRRPSSSQQDQARSIRPGQKSSALSKNGGKASSPSGKDDAPAASTHRKSRRRSHKTGSDTHES